MRNASDGLAIEVRAVLVENRFLVARYAAAPPWQRLASDAEDLFRRFLADPSEVDPAEVSAISHQAEAGGRWRIERDGQDPFAEPRRRRLELLSQISRAVTGLEVIPFSLDFPTSDSARGESLTRLGAPPRARVLAVPGETPKERRKRIIGAKIRELREAQTPRMTLDQLAAKLGTDRSHIIRWESGKWEPDAYYLERLAEVFGIPVYEFYRGIEAAA